ncbi:hypothetical protein BZA77DRAFT_84373 [Pyronema omphalodes]|nr:hypothetical protein BZA77DRAFT_84373 [Pyronema omphalodes]
MDYLLGLGIIFGCFAFRDKGVICLFFCSCFCLHCVCLDYQGSPRGFRLHTRREGFRSRPEDVYMMYSVRPVLSSFSWFFYCWCGALVLFCFKVSNSSYDFS